MSDDPTRPVISGEEFHLRLFEGCDAVAIEIRRGFRHSDRQEQSKKQGRFRIMRMVLSWICITALVGCGGASSSSKQSTVTRSAGTGLIERACNRSDRRAANPALCACVQQAADVTLSSADQRLAVTFYNDPHKAQVIRQSDRTRDEAFWTRYKNYAETAEAYCRAA